jgi:VanZ family protein
VASERATRTTAAWLLALTVLFMLHASLFPFDFDLERLRSVGPQQWAKALAWRRPIRSDIIANLLFYLPFGALLAFLAPRRWGAARRWASVVLAGALVSCSIELAQFATRGRDPSVVDVTMNTLSAGLGALVALALTGIGVRVRAPELRQHRPDPFAALLCLAWFAFHAAPFMPNAPRFVRYFSEPALLLQGGWSLASTAAFAAGYVVLAAAVRAIFHRSSFWKLFTTCVVLSLLARILFKHHRLDLSEPLGLLLALPVIVLVVARPGTPRLAAAAAFATAALVVHGLAGFAGGVEWPSFAPLETLKWTLRGAGAEPGLLEAGFLYGGLTWLLAQAGVPLRRALPWLFAGSGLLELTQGFQPGRDAHLAAPVAVLFGALLTWAARPLARPLGGSGAHVRFT